ncbi:MAG: YCF48-related protein [bacterium]|nr:YCF48-related protein [bacterium]
MRESPNLLDPNGVGVHHGAYALTAFVFVFALALFSVSSLLPTGTFAAAPTLSGGSPTAGTGGVVTTADVTVASNTALAPGSLGGTNFQAASGYDGLPGGEQQEIFMFDSTTGYAVGANGEIRKTTDGGIIWALQTSGTTNRLWSVHFPDANTGYAVGASSTVVKTTNGGSTWSSVTTGIAGTYNAVWCTDTSICFVFGTNTANPATGIILKTTNGGLNWSQIASNNMTLGGMQRMIVRAEDIEFVSASVGIAVGGRIETGVGGGPYYDDLILMTVDGGSSWRALDPPRATSTSDTTRALLSVDLIDTNTVYAVGTGGHIAKTTNLSSLNVEQDIQPTWTTLTSGVTDTLNELACTSTSACWVATVTADATTGQVLATTDSGSTWSAQSIGTASVFDALAAPSSSLVLVMGYDRILRYNGSTWTNRVFGDDDYRGAYVVSASEAYVVGENGKIVKSTDNGATWTEQTSGETVQWEGVHCASSGNCWAVGASGKIRKTSDGGTTWTAVTKPSGISGTIGAVFMQDANIVWIGGTDAKLFKTTDGGTAWAQSTDGFTTSAEIVEIAFASTTVGYVVVTDGANGNNAFVTTNGGTSWSGSEALDNVAPFGVAVVDANTAYVAGASGKISKTTNGGGAWTAQTSGIANSIQDIHCINTSTCWAVYSAVDANDLVGYLYTADGGTTWTEQTIGSSTGASVTRQFMTMSGANTTSMLFVGGKGAIYRPTYRVRLQTASGNVSSGAATGDNLCTNVTYATDTDTVTCAHGTLTAGTWYVLTVVGDDGGTNSGVTASDSSELATSFTKHFRTAFASNASPVDITAAAITDLAAEGYLIIPTGESTTALSQATADIEIRQSVSMSAGSARVTLPDGVVLTKAGGGTFDLTAVTLADSTSTVSANGTASHLGAIGGVVQYGLANATLNASANVSVRIPVDSSFNGATLNVFRSATTDFSTRIPTDPNFTCTVALGFCEINTTSFSYFLMILTGAPKGQTDIIKPQPPTNLKSSGSARQGVTFTWDDPADTDLDRIRLYLRVGPARLLIGVVPPGVEQFTYQGSFLIGGGVYNVNVESIDTSGNRSDMAEQLFFLPPAFLVDRDNAPPGVPTNIGASAQPGKVVITWKDPEDSDVEIIDVHRVIDGVPVRRGTLDRGDERFTDADERLVDGSYLYSLVAIDFSGNASDLAIFTVTIGDGEAEEVSQPDEEVIDALAPPTNLRASSSNGKVYLTWIDPTSPALTELRVLLVIDGKEFERGTVQSGVGKFTDTGSDLSLNVSYRYAVQAVGHNERISDVATVGIIVRGADRPALERGDVPESVSDLLANAPCSLSLVERSFLAAAFRRSQQRPPTRTESDLAFLCGLRIDPRMPEDITEQFPGHRNLNAEGFALKNFTNFFKRPPSVGFNNEPLPEHIADRDWMAVKHMAYHFLIDPTARDPMTERACLRLFTNSAIELYKGCEKSFKDCVKTLKPAGRGPADEDDFAFIRACSYSGAAFIGTVGDATAPQ